MGKQRHISRLHVEADLSAGAELELPATLVHRLVTVMRSKAGDAVLVFNGRDGEWRGALAHVSRKSATVTLDAQVRPQPRPAGITLAFAPLKHARLDYLAQKAAELGVSRVVPVLSEHTQVNRVNTERLRANLVEGAEQCGVLWIADVAQPQTLAEFLRQTNEPIVFCDEAAPIADPVRALAGLAPPLAVLIGPEGGFSHGERDELRGLSNATAISLGPRVMRADTASVAALALVQAVCGDWRHA